MAAQEIYPEQFKTLAAQRVPNAMRTLSLMLIIGVAAAMLFLYFVPWVQTTSGFGSVSALNPNDRQQEINALVPGRIQEWYVRDGSHVNVGDPIVRIADVDPQLIQRLNAERDQVIAQLRAAETAQQTAEIDRDRTQSLFDQGLASRREFEQSQIRVEELRSRVAEAAAALTRADVNLSRQSVQIVRAPRDGVILRVFAGDAATFVQAGDVVATFVPDNASRMIELFIDGRDVALVTPGAPVRLQFEGWPAIQFSGWPSVAVGTFSGTVVAVDPSADVSGRFRVLVAEDEEAEIPWPNQQFVRFGSKARGWVLLETVPAGYELWRQLNNFPARLPSLPEDGA
ncbi:MAG: HlyD family efflux transporter periplasmic adaptor subunit [Gammaproteobacteria bacterium]|nr:HlyD family efflux transporter periplasmic adaptor subunit [Gammaproteobacteria bacterium]